MNPSVLTVLRDKVPLRPLTFAEHLRIAEMQAHLFLKLVNVHEAPVPTRVIEELPRIQVNHVSPLPVSGATHWTSGRWLVLLNATEPRVRQRFSLAHEFKHIIDNRFADLIYQGLPEADRAQLIEQICDFFAGCVLLPRPWLKSTYAGGLQRLPDLAARFDVSQAAVQVRLNQIGMAEPAARCARPSDRWLTERFRASGRRIYQRSKEPVFAAPLTP
jgi:Zn-dependent peptidase ImmA (M78 family)